MEQENMQLAVLEKEDVKKFETAGELVAFLKNSNSSIQLTDKEAELILNYFEGHDYAVGECDGKLMRGDLAEGNDKISWEEYSIDDVIDIVCEWNYELILEEDAKRRNPEDFVGFVNSQNYYDELKAEEVILDKLFEKTTFYKDIEEMTVRLVNEFIGKIQGNDELKEELDEAVGDIVKQVAAYGNERTGR